MRKFEIHFKSFVKYKNLHLMKFYLLKEKIQNEISNKKLVEFQ
jgi:hypothetical protein